MINLSIRNYEREVLLLESTVIFWTAAIILFLVVEAATAGLTCIWFALGSAAALLTAWLRGPIWLQIVWFLVVSVAALLLTRPLAKKFINARKEPTNADRVLGRIGIVTETVDNVAATGAVKVDGQVWTARSADDDVIAMGERVEALEIRGVKLIVKKV
ncbi:MAG: NfeD family protein [Ruminococcaceae bacterium]|nr:NfeD family protein [Oscillospiraceae bacterium]